MLFVPIINHTCLINGGQNRPANPAGLGIQLNILNQKRVK